MKPIKQLLREERRVFAGLHEIRHELHKELKKKSLDEINRSAKAVFQNWKSCVSLPASELQPASPE